MVRYRHLPDREGFDVEIWEIVRRIPPGRVCTYGRLARLAGAPPGMDGRAFAAFGARWAGGALARSPADVPWHRVVNAQGRVSDRPGAERQRPLLEKEGVAFDGRGRIDLDRFGWEPG